LLLLLPICHNLHSAHTRVRYASSAVLQVLQMEEGPSLQMAPETFNLRLEELAVIDMAFLAASSSSSGPGGAGSSAAAAAAGAANPVLALLYEDNKHARHVKTYTLNLKTRVRGSCPPPVVAYTAGTCCVALQTAAPLFYLSSALTIALVASELSCLA
jgi:hypothetical protein